MAGRCARTVAVLVLTLAVSLSAPLAVSAAVPSDIALSNNVVPEGAPIGTVVGLITSPEPGDSTVSFSLVAGDVSAFEISGAALRTAQVFSKAAQTSYTITIRATDSSGGSFEKDFTIVVGDANPPPDASPESYTVKSGGFLSVIAPGVLGNDHDPVGEPLQATPFRDVLHGGLLLDGEGGFTYQPDAGYAGPDSFSYRAYDGMMYSQPATVTINVIIPLPPSDLLLSNTTVGEGLMFGELVGTLSTLDPDSATFQYSIVAGGDGDFYIRAPNELRTARALDHNYRPSYDITIRTMDPAEGLTLDKTFTITVTHENRAPIAMMDSYSTRPATTLTVAPTGVLTNDSDPDHDPITAVTAVEPGHGTLSMRPDGGFTYKPTAGFEGSDSFAYRAFDGIAYSETTTVEVAVTTSQVNSPPSASNDSYSTRPGSPLTIPAPGILANDSDPDHDAIYAALVSTPGHGVLTLLPTGGFTYTPEQGYMGPDSFSYRAYDGSLYSTTATVDLSVSTSHVNVRPVAVADRYSTLAGVQLGQPAPGVLGNDFDPDMDAVYASLGSAPLHGTLVLLPDGSFVYSPQAGYVGVDSFTYRAYDGELYSATTTVEVSITAPPVVKRASALTIKASRSSARIGQSVSFSGRATPYPGMVGRRVTLQVRRPGKATWTTLSTRTVKASRGVAVWSYSYLLKRGTAKGVHRFRAYHAAGAYKSSTSRTVSVAVR